MGWVPQLQLDVTHAATVERVMAAWPGNFTYAKHVARRYATDHWAAAAAAARQGGGTNHNRTAATSQAAAAAAAQVSFLQLSATLFELVCRKGQWS